MRERIFITNIVTLLILVFTSACSNAAVTKEEPVLQTSIPISTAESSVSAAETPVQVKTIETAGTVTDIDAAVLVKDRCTVCHSSARIESKKASLDGWTQTVERMIGNGAVLNAEEKDAIIRYLAATYPE